MPSKKLSESFNWSGITDNGDGTFTAENKAARKRLVKEFHRQGFKSRSTKLNGGIYTVRPIGMGRFRKTARERKNTLPFFDDDSRRFSRSRTIPVRSYQRPHYPPYRPIYRRSGFVGYRGPPPRIPGRTEQMFGQMKRRAALKAKEENPYLLKGKLKGSPREPASTPYFIDESGNKQPREGWRIRDGKFERDPTFRPSIFQRIFSKEQLKKERQREAQELERPLRGESDPAEQRQELIRKLEKQRFERERLAMEQKKPLLPLKESITQSEKRTEQRILDTRMSRQQEQRNIRQEAKLKQGGWGGGSIKAPEIPKQKIDQDTLQEARTRYITGE